MTDRIFIDNGLLGVLCKDTKGNLWNSFLDTLNSRGLYLKDRRNCFTTAIFLFLEFIGLGIPSTLPPIIKDYILVIFMERELDFWARLFQAHT